MSAFFQQEPRIRPLPAREGFSVDANAFVNSSFTVVESFTLGLNEPCSSLSLASLDCSSVPLIKVHPVDDGGFFRNDHLEELRPENFAMLAYNDEAAKYDKSRHYSRYIEDLPPDVGKPTEDEQLLCEANSLKSMTSHPSILSLVIDDCHQMLSDEIPGDNEVDAIEKDEGNTSISTLDSGGPRTPPRSPSPVLSDVEDTNFSDRDLKLTVAGQKGRRPTNLSLKLCDTSFALNHAVASGSNSDVHSALTTSPSIRFFLDAESDFFAEPLTPVAMNTFGIQDRTPTHIRTPMAKLTKTKFRAGLGKENIAPLTMLY